MNYFVRIMRYKFKEVNLTVIRLSQYSGIILKFCLCPKDNIETSCQYRENE